MCTGVGAGGLRRQVTRAFERATKDAKGACELTGLCAARFCRDHNENAVALYMVLLSKGLPCPQDCLASLMTPFKILPTFSLRFE